MAPRNDDEDDPEVDEEPDDEDDDADLDDDADGDDESDDDENGSEEDEDDESDDEVEEEAEEDADGDAPTEPRRPRSRARGPGGMGRPSSGPAIRGASERPVGKRRSRGEPVSATEPVTELAPDITTWPGTTEAARMVGRHTSTIKLWRTQGRIRATQDASGCWRHHPDDLAEAIDTPDATDPGSVLASGMSAIVQQGASANERLLAMTEIATDGLKDATTVLSKELERAYVRITELEVKLADLRDKHAATHADDLKHERFVRKLDLKHEIELASARETSQRLNGLLTILGPIAASIGARMLGLDRHADRVEAAAAGVAPPNVASPAAPAASAPTPEGRTVPIETRITDAMARLCAAIRLLDKPAFAGLRAMLPPPVAAALDDIADNQNDSAVGRALAIIVKAAQNLSDLQFRALRPIAPSEVAAVLAELRELLRNDDAAPIPPHAD